jgi:hypothetical protein
MVVKALEVKIELWNLDFMSPKFWQNPTIPFIESNRIKRPF